ncbi:glycosyltransferase [Sporolactobacillus terrae]|uniref:glycosyltransferase n=1 Tax=Sporolactobacillus terrae TaxID=269673 RepID=UPI001CBBC509|nr:glycosyltransferase [Sporolactobacillus terrae]UAK16380.1 glycosyltransferase [Sporolactobacillus terrae]
MKKIVFLTRRYNLGGAERVNAIIGNYLNQSDEFKVYFYSEKDIEPFFQLDGEFVKYESSRFEKLPIIGKAIRGKRVIIQKLNNGQYDPNHVSGRFKNQFTDFCLKEGVDTVVISSPELISLIPDMKQQMNNVKIISWLHNGWVLYLNKDKNPVYKPFINGIKAADIVVALTHEDRDKFIEINKNTKCIYNPLTIKNEEHSALKSKNIAFASRYAIEQKGIDYLAEVAAKLPDRWKITFAGSGNETEVENVNRLFEVNNSLDKVDFLGLLKDDELRDFYLSASMYLMTSRFEGFGLVLSEAMSFGLPVLAFEQTGSKEVLSNGRYGILVENGNVSKMSEKISELIENRDILIDYQKKSLERVGDFKLEKIAKKWKEIL